MTVIEELLREDDFVEGYDPRYGLYQRQNRLIEGYLDARQKAEDTLAEHGLTFEDSLLESDEEEIREAGSTSDFSTYLSALVTKRLMTSYREQPSSWRLYSRLYNVPDLKPISFTRVGESEQLLEIPEGSPYTDSQVEQIIGPSLSVKKFGRTFKLTMETLINDDLGQLRDRPASMGRAAARTLGHAVVKMLETNPLTYDGNALASTTHKNLLNGSQYALSEDTLGRAITLLRQQTEYSGNIIGLQPWAVVVPVAQQLTLDRILTSTMVPQPQTGLTPPEGQQFGRGERNVVQRIAHPIVEDYLVDQLNWYLFANPADAAVLGTGFLGGRQIPDIFLFDPGMRNVRGGSDPYNEAFDEISWKIRHFWGTGVYDWRGVVKASVG